MTAAADVGVAIPARQAVHCLEAAVCSALQQGVGAVVIAVDPADRATSRLAHDLAAKHQSVRVVDNPAGSTPAALNRAIGALDTPIVARLDAHARFDDGYVQAALDALARTGAAVVGGRQRAVGTSPLQRAVAAAMSARAGAGNARHHVGGRAGTVETAYLGVFDRAWLDRVGGYDERLARNQDYEICHRLGQAGGTVWFAPAMSATYSPRGSWADLIRQYHDYGRWKRRVMVQAPRSMRPRQLAPPALILGLAISAGVRSRGHRAGWALPVLYVGGLGVAAARLQATAGPDLSRAERVRAAGVLAVMHLAWGSGFWRGGR